MEYIYLKTKGQDVLKIDTETAKLMTGKNPEKSGGLKGLFSTGYFATQFFIVDEKAYEEAKSLKGKPFIPTKKEKVNNSQDLSKEVENLKNQLQEVLKKQETKKK